MRRVLAILVVMVLVVGGIGLRGDGTVARAARGGGRLADGIGVGGGERFVGVEVVIDSGREELGAYQVEVVMPAGVTIVGLEGGEAARFREAPFYDPAALVGRRVVAAAFSTEGGLPRGKVKVARLHLMVEGGMGDAALKGMEKKLVVATDGEGRTIEAGFELGVLEGAK